MRWCGNTIDPVSIKLLHWKSHSMKIECYYLLKVINYPRTIVHKRETQRLGKNVITTLGIFKKQAVLWVANRPWSPVYLCLISSIHYYCINPIHLSRPDLIIPCGKREHSLKPAQSYGFTGELADNVAMSARRASGHCQAEAKLALPNGGQVTWKNKYVFSLPPNHKFSWQLLQLNDVWEFSSSLKCGWNWPEFLWGQEGVGGKKERVREKTGLKITTFGFFQAIYPGILENVMCKRIPSFFH